ncbi:MAG: hypothetical protein JW795_15035 [Chitinivibrionales bacterium]|nr:hypothetical protein [Chitinivibrionales bacterium]
MPRKARITVTGAVHHHIMSRGNRGYLFQDRYTSIVTQNQNYLEEMVSSISL